MRKAPGRTVAITESRKQQSVTDAGRATYGRKLSAEVHQPRKLVAKCNDDGLSRRWKSRGPGHCIRHLNVHALPVTKWMPVISKASGCNLATGVSPFKSCDADLQSKYVYACCSWAWPCTMVTEGGGTARNSA